MNMALQSTRDPFLLLCHLVREDHVSSVLRQSATLLADYFRSSEAAIMLLDALGMNLVPSGGWRKGDANWVSENMPVEIEEDRRKDGPFAQAILSGRSVLADARFIVPLRHGNGTTLGVALLTPADESCCKTLQSREAELLLGAVGGVLAQSLGRRVVQENNIALTTSLTRADSDRQLLRDRIVHGLEARLPGKSPALSALRGGILRQANEASPLLILGPDGAGKERVALEIHRASRKARAPFVFVNSRDLTSETFAPLVYGHKRGAIAGVAAARKGYLREAGEGVVYFDRVDLLPREIQVRLDRVLETECYRPLGNERNVPLTARMIFSGAPELRNGAGDMLPSLYNRITKSILERPSLQHCKDDLPSIVEVLLSQHTRRTKRRLFLSADVVPWLQNQHFSGDLRELESLFERAFERALETGEQLSPVAFSPVVAAPTKACVTSGAANASLKQMVAQYEKAVLTSALKRCGFDRDKAAKDLNIPKRTLADKCKKYQLS